MKKTKRDKELKKMLRPIKKSIMSGEALKRYTNIPIDELMDDKENETILNATESFVVQTDDKIETIENDSNLINMKSQSSSSSYSSSRNDGSTKSRREVRIDLKISYENSLRKNSQNIVKSLNEIYHNDEMSEISKNQKVINYKNQPCLESEESSYSVNLTESEGTIKESSREFDDKNSFKIDLDQNLLTRVNSVPLDRNLKFIESQKIKFYSNNYLTPNTLNLS
jgi:hypothetical protein